MPGAEVANCCFTGMGCVVTKKHVDDFVLLAGVPARRVRPLKADDAYFKKPFLKQGHHSDEYTG